MAKETVRVNVRLTAEAAAELERRAPSVNKRGAYLSALIMQAGQPVPAAQPAADSPDAAYAAIGRQVLSLARELARSFPALLADDAGAPGGTSES